MPGAVIVFNQPTAGTPAGTPGTARNDGRLEHDVELTCSTTQNTSLRWELVAKPTGSSASLTNDYQLALDGPFVAAIFTPDVPGTYRVHLRTNGGGPGNDQIKVIRVRYDEDGALVNRGWCLPAYGERAGEGNYTGSTVDWAEPWEFILSDLLTITGSSGHDITVTPIKTGDYTAVAWQLVRCDPTGAGFTVTLPLASSAGSGAIILIKNCSASTNTITVARTGSDTIDGATSDVLNNAREVHKYMSDGTSDWMEIL